MTSGTPIRVLVADDNALMRLGVVTLIRAQTDMEVVGEASGGVEAVALYRKLRPDVLLLDLRMPVMDGAQVITAICSETPDAAILVLTHYDRGEDIFRAVKAGARGYTTKDVAGPEILTALRAVASGKRYLPAELSERLADRMSQPSLSQREKEVLDCLFEGLTNREIGERLALSEKTATIYVSRLLDKLGAKSRTEAIAIALRRGLLSAQ